MKFKILILTENYPDYDVPYAMSYVHSRNLEYIKQNVDVDVMNFSAKGKYEFENVNVLSRFDLIEFDQYDAVFSHAPNLKNHLKLLLSNINKIKVLVFFFHGHEVLKINEYYPEKYSWQRKHSTLKVLFQNSYDYLKLFLIKSFIKKFRKKIKVVYVSSWMREAARNCLGLNENLPYLKEYIINNPANYIFVENKYQFLPKDKLGDFITIRPLDDRKYAVDLVVEMARNNPEYIFHIYGKGEYFKYNKQPGNVVVYDKFINQSEIPKLLNYYKCALMPTRLDAQGVMMCEIATYGMPLITSNLDVCKEMLSDFKNVQLVCNDKFATFKVNSVFDKQECQLNRRFDAENIARKELEILNDA